MKQNFFDQLDGRWGDLLADTYEEANKFKIKYVVKEGKYKSKYKNILDIHKPEEILKDTILELDDDVNVIGYAAFANCKNLIGNLYLPNSIHFLGSRAFMNCGFTGDLKLPENLDYLDSECFYGCDGFSNGQLILNEKLIFIQDRAFMNCGFAGDLIIPESVNYIGSYAFAGCNFDKIYVDKSNVNIFSENWNSGCNAEIVYY